MMLPRCRVVPGLAGLSLLCLLPLRAQQLTLPQNGEALPTFEVDTIKPAAPDAPGSRVQWTPDGYRMDNVPLSLIIRDAFDARSDAQLIGGPQALLDRHFDLQAKMDAKDAAQMKALSRDDGQRRMDLMMQALLRDRFQLKMHVETRVLPVYALVVAKGGPKLQPTAPAAPAPATDPDAGPPPPPGMSGPMPRHLPPGSSMMRISSNRAEASVSGGTMQQLASMLTGQEEIGSRLIVDKTGLTGKYDWYLAWTPASARVGTEPKGADGSSDSDAPGLLTALQEQLGLRLEAQKAPVQVIVIDHLEPPSPN